MFKVRRGVSFRSSCAKYPCVSCLNCGSTELLELKENSVAPVIRLAMGQPPSGSKSAAVWSCRKLNDPPGSMRCLKLNCDVRNSPPNLNECLPVTHVRASDTCQLVSKI